MASSPTSIPTCATSCASACRRRARTRAAGNRIPIAGAASGDGPAAERVERFRADLAALTGDAGGRFGIAVSGGPDSLALLILAAAAAAPPGRIEAATVDHGLRPESADEAKFVGRICGDLGVPHAILRPSTPITGSLQAAARQARYDRLEAWRRAQGLGWVLTAHHADDQAETLMMRLDRGAGVGGLSGIRAINGRILRPLLGWRRAELEAIVRDAGIAPIADPSNADERFDRARLRRRLAEAGWIDAAALARSALALAEADAALDWAADGLVAERGGGGAEARIDVEGVPAELRRRLLLRMLRRVAPEADPRGGELSRLLATLDRGGIATLAGVKCVAGGSVWRFERAPPRRK